MIATRYERLDKFIESLKGDVYPEPEDNGSFIDAGFKTIKHKIKKGDSVLDIGCGQGYALALFEEAGAKPIGITLCDDDMKTANFRNWDVRLMDLHDMDFESNTFDGVWARHSLEHSIFPYYTLSECYRLLKPKGWIYIEVPAPQTIARHETNKNHYSVLPIMMWGNLMDRVGFEDITLSELKFTIDAGEDSYYRLGGVKSE